MKKIVLPFVSRKKYNIVRENYKITQKMFSDIQQRYKNFQIEVKDREDKMKLSYSQMEDSNKTLCNNLEYYEVQVKDLKKEIARLKSLLTKNKVSYKKKGEKNGK